MSANMLENFNNEQIAKQLGEKNFPKFFPGDTIVVKVKIGERSQNYEGICIAKKNRGLHSSFAVRKISDGEGVERVFPYYSPNVLDIKVLKKGAVRRAKLYYLKNKVGKSGRISAATSGYKTKL